MKSIAILGYGVVGSGVVEIINNNMSRLKDKIGEEVKLAKILVKDLSKHVDNPYHSLLTDKIEDIFDENVDIVVEVMGGVNPAYDYIKKFLDLKKHIVTANKDLIAKHGDELLDIAKDNGVKLYFEASVGGGIPILRPLSECLMGNTFNSVSAILNGTTNFILSKMDKDNMGYDEALKIAQNLGFAEANPESDVMGYDSARKLSILSTIAFDQRVNWENIDIQGITDIDAQDIKCAKQMGCKIKLLAMSSRVDEKIYASVRPVMVEKDSSIGKIDDEFNGIILNGDAVGNMMFYGKGAGKLPTASAVFGDIINIIQNKKEKALSFNKQPAIMEKSYTKKSKWMVRVACVDRYSVMGELGKFSDCYFDIGNELEGEVLAYVAADNQKALEEKLGNLKNMAGVEKVKAFLILKDN